MFMNLYRDMKAALKLMPPILLCWPTTSKANVVDMAVEVEPSRQYSVKFCCRATDDSRGVVWQNGISHGSAYETEVCNWIPPCRKNCIQCLLNVYRDQTMDVSTVMWWVARFSSGDDVKDKPCSGRPRTTVTPWNEERLDQLIRTNQQITTMEPCTGLNIQRQARKEDNLSLAIWQRQAPYQYEDRRAHCQSWVDCLTTPTL
jgi:hypothetical protein